MGIYLFKRRFEGVLKAVDTSHLNSDILDKIDRGFPYLNYLAWLQDLAGPVMEVLKNFLNIQVKRPVDLMQLWLLLVAQQVLQLMEKEVYFSCSELSTLIISELNASLVLICVFKIVTSIRSLLGIVKLQVWDAVEEGVDAEK